MSEYELGKFSIEHNEDNQVPEKKDRLFFDLPLEEIRKMYTISGSEPVTAEDVEKYSFSRKKIADQFPEIVAQKMKACQENYSPDSDNFRIRTYDYPVILELMANISLEERMALSATVASIIRKEFSDNSFVGRVAGIPFIKYAPLEERASLLRLVLENDMLSVVEKVVELINEVPDTEQADLWDVVGKIIHAKLLQPYWGERQAAAEFIPKIPDGFLRSELMNLLAQEIRSALPQENDGLQIRFIAAATEFVFPEQQAEFLDLLTPFVEKPLREGTDWYAIRQAESTIKYLPKPEQLRLLNYLPDLVRRGLEDKNFVVYEEAVYCLKSVPIKERAALIRLGLAHAFPRVRLEAATHIKTLPEDEQEPLYAEYYKYKSLTEEELRTLAISTPLYKNASGKFFKRNFEKSGTVTTLLDAVPGVPEKSLKNRVILRHIPINAYRNWVQAFENCGFWQEKGFDYVPIEPIIRAKLDSDGTVSVSTRVLGTSVEAWKKQTPLFRREIDQKVEQITKAIEEMGIVHGHPHENNFCLVFERTPEGVIDLTKPPRVYLIDFDEAKSKQTIKSERYA